MNSFVSVFVSGMSGQCQKYVVNFEGVGIPPKLDQPPRKENGSYPHMGGSVSKNSVRVFCLFPWRSLGCPVPGPVPVSRPVRSPVPGPVA